MKRSCLFTLIIFFIFSIPLGCKIEKQSLDKSTVNIKLPNIDSVIEPGPNVEAEIKSALTIIVPQQYGIDKDYQKWDVIKVGPLKEHVLYGMGQKIGGKQLTDMSYYVELHFPRLEPSASLSLGQLFMAKTRNGWIAWYQYH